MKPATLAMVKRAIATRSAELGATIDLFVNDLGTDGVDLCAWTPAGWVWNVNVCHSVVGRSFTRPAEAYQQLLADLAAGFSRCELDDCDTCDPEV